MTTILVLEDTDAVRTAIVRIVATRMGWTAFQAATNRQARDLLAEHRIDVVIQDMHRPGGSGFDFMRDESAFIRHHRVRVVLASGVPSVYADRVQELLDLGVDRFLPKPFGPDELVSTLSGLVGEPPRDALLALILAGVEDAETDFKLTCDWGSRREVAGIAKDVIAMRNGNLVGYIVFGVGESPDGRRSFPGVAPDRLPEFEPTRVNDKLSRYTGPSSAVRVQNVHHGSKTFVVLRVEPDLYGLSLARRSHEAAGLHPGRIYARTAAARSEEVRDEGHLNALLERCMRARLHRTVCNEP